MHTLNVNILNIYIFLYVHVFYNGTEISKTTASAFSGTQSYNHSVFVTKDHGLTFILFLYLVFVCLFILFFLMCFTYINMCF